MSSAQITAPALPPHVTISGVNFDTPSLILFVVGTLIGIVGVAVGVAASRKAAHTEAEPKYRVGYSRLLSLPVEGKLFPPFSDESLMVTYNGRTVTDVRRAHLALWNSGARPLVTAAEGGQERISVRLEGVEPVFALGSPGSPRVIAASREEFNPSVSLSDGDERVIEIGLDFLRRDEGVLIEFLYSGRIENLTFGGLPPDSRLPVNDGELKLYENKKFPIALQRSSSTPR